MNALRRWIYDLVRPAQKVPKKREELRVGDRVKWSMQHVAEIKKWEAKGRLIRTLVVSRITELPDGTIEVEMTDVA